MRYTNKHNIPKEIVRAIHNDSYSRGDAEISVTGLLQPPRINLLRKKHDEKIESLLKTRNQLQSNINNFQNVYNYKHVREVR